uniref:Beclin 2 n=1 Tax=Myotis lucifugus TaxID=59463 RepID=G1PZN5_MYOLU
LESTVKVKTSTVSSIRFTCHFCRGPLKLTCSTETLGLDLSQEPAALKFPLAQGEPGATPEEGSTSRMEILVDLEELQYSASGWTILGDNEISGYGPSNFTLLRKLGSGRTLSSIQRATRGVSDIPTGEEELDHSLWEGCTDGLREQLDTPEKCCLETRDGLSEDAREALQEELKVVELEEVRLVQELEEVEKNRERAAMAQEVARAETETLEQQERQYYGDLGELQWQQLELQDELWSVEDRLLYAQTQLTRLKKTNAFKAVFEICCDGPLAIINSFRLGCVPTVPESCSEINTAWGTALLLLALSNAVGLQFQKYRLFPGDHCYLKSLIDDPMELPILCTWDNKFDEAMVAFLDCMQQFKEEAEKGEPAFCMPYYTIHVGKGLMEDPGVSIRTHLNKEEQQTKALKLMLINFKWSLAWVSLRYHHK